MYPQNSRCEPDRTHIPNKTTLQYNINTMLLIHCDKPNKTRANLCCCSKIEPDATSSRGQDKHKP